MASSSGERERGESAVRNGVIGEHHGTEGDQFGKQQKADPLKGARVIGARAGPNSVTPAAARPPHRRRGM